MAHLETMFDAKVCCIFANERENVLFLGYFSLQSKQLQPGYVSSSLPLTPKMNAGNRSCLFLPCILSVVSLFQGNVWVLVSE